MEIENILGHWVKRRYSVLLKVWFIQKNIITCINIIL